MQSAAIPEPYLLSVHDRYFINRIATRILELKGKQLYSFIGNYDYYESHKDQVYEAAAPKQTDTSADTVTAPSATPSGKDDYKKQKEEQARLRKKENDIKKNRTKKLKKQRQRLRRLTRNS